MHASTGGGAILKSDATIHLASRGMSALGAVICSWEDEGGVTFSDLTLSNSWATNKTCFFGYSGPGAKKRSFGKKQSSDLDHYFNGLWKPKAYLYIHIHCICICDICIHVRIYN